MITTQVNIHNWTFLSINSSFRYCPNAELRKDFPLIVLMYQQTSSISAWCGLSQLLVSHLGNSVNLSCIQAGSFLGSKKAR